MNKCILCGFDPMGDNPLGLCPACYAEFCSSLSPNGEQMTGWENGEVLGLLKFEQASRRDWAPESALFPTLNSEDTQG